MIGCWCHDPVVFGHWFGCGRLRLQEPVEEEPLVRRRALRPAC